MTKIKVFDLTLGIIGAVVLVGAGFAWYQWNQLNQGLEAKLEEQKKELRTITAKVQEYRENSARTQEIKDEIKRLAVFIPDKEGQAQFIYELERMASAAGLEIDSCRLEKQAARITGYPKYSVFRWRVELNGSYPDLLNFIKELPKSNRFVNMADLKVGSVVDEKTNLYSLNIACTLDLMTTATLEKVK